MRNNLQSGDTVLYVLRGASHYGAAELLVLQHCKPAFLCMDDYVRFCHGML